MGAFKLVSFELVLGSKTAFLSLETTWRMFDSKNIKDNSKVKVSKD
jgi:hypothetical protein